MRWWYTAVCEIINKLSSTEKRIINSVIKAPGTTENTLLPKLGITVGEFCVVQSVSKM